MNKIKILTVSNTAWSDENSFGLTYNALFGGLEDNFEFANIYCNYGVPRNSCVKKYCQITEKTIIESLKNKKAKICRVFDCGDEAQAEVLGDEEAKARNNIKKRRLQLSMWARDLVWKQGLCDMSEIIDFVNDFKPDVIFTPMYYMFHTNKILQAVIKAAGVPVISYISDDIYRTTKFVYSPLYAIDRLLKRRTIAKSVSMCDMIYTACEEQAEEYKKIFGKKCKVLRKPAEKSLLCENKGHSGEKVSFVYAGNLGTGRAETVNAIGRCISENGGVLKVYSATPVTNSVKKKFKKNGIDYRGYISSAVAEKECRMSDVLLYAEGFGRKAVALTKYSVSTKFSGYLCSGKIILAVGPETIHTVKYLKRENAAVVVSCREDFDRAVKECMKDSMTVINNALLCAERDFNKENIQRMLKADILGIVGERGDCV